MKLVHCILLAALSLPLFAENKELFMACQQGNTSKVEQLLTGKINLNEVDSAGNTALMIAAHANQREVLKLLVDAGASLNTINKEGQTALTLCRLNSEADDFRSYKHLWECYDYLKQQGAEEQDFVTYIVENISGKDALRQQSVLQVKKDFAHYNKVGGSYKEKRYTDRDSTEESDEEYYSMRMHEYNYWARFDSSGKLAYFRHKEFTHSEWTDNGSMSRSDHHYYLKEGKLYFYFVESRMGYPHQQEQNQHRLYIQDGKKVLHVHRYHDVFGDIYPPYITSVNDYVNLEDTSNSITPKQIQIQLDSVYNRVKNHLR